MSTEPVSAEDSIGTDACHSPDAVRERLVGALDEYIKAVHEIASGHAERVAAPQRDYLRAVADAQADPAAAERLRGAYLEQLHRIVDLLGDDASKEANAAAQRAYGAYLRTVASIVASVPEGGEQEALPAAVLAGLGQHFLLVAQWAGACGTLEASGSFSG